MKAASSLSPEIKKLAESLVRLYRQGVQEYSPVVDDIIATRCRDIRHIERTLDGLLDFCGYEPALLLYKKLCRYYFDIDPVATAGYINAYRELWDTEDEKQPAKKKDMPSASRKAVKSSKTMKNGKKFANTKELFEDLGI